ncbi:polyketide synthase-like protein [Nemania abortiva]|nr:polyketide synthase-like protein [Nemania abortiva]
MEPQSCDHMPATSIPGQGEDPVCIVGMGCRLPGGIRSPSMFWDFLTKVKSAQGLVPNERYNIDGFYHPDGKRAGVMDTKGGYFLSEDVRLFDNSFFGINNLEAMYMDPQQRKLLEVVFECLEHAGISLEEISGSNTAVCVGNFTIDYQTIQARDPDYYHRYHATGSGTAIMANRISHIFNLQGPSFTLDTACSSSIYCLHMAVNALQNNECEAAIVAGANLITSPEQQLGTMKGGVLSPTSTCHTFDESADGYGRGEAVNALYLKRLSSATRDGNKTWAVIRATAVNSNGKTPGISLPSSDLQELVIRKAYLKAGIDTSGTDYVECHGTGTAVGDPIEIEALWRCFSSRSVNHSPLIIGSVKTNLGHSEGASGLTSLMKVALAFNHGLIPATYGVARVNPKLKLESRNMKIAMQNETWPRSLRRASINSFGYGGANAHVILESLESYLGRITHPHNSHSIGSEILTILPISAASEYTLKARLIQVQKAVKHTSQEAMRKLAFTMTKRTINLRLKDVLIAASSPGEGSRVLEVYGSLRETSVAPRRLPVAFIFTGQGAQYRGMGSDLLHNTTFVETIRDLDCVLQSLPSAERPLWRLEQIILDTECQVDDPSRSQPLCTAIQIALVKVLQSWQVNPRAVLGHSSGEIAAAFSAGYLNATQAIIVAYYRGYAASRLDAEGEMLVVGTDSKSAQAMIAALGLEQEVSVACVNAPNNITLSGYSDPIRKILAALQGNGIFARLLNTGKRAYHSPMMIGASALYASLISPYLDLGGQDALEEIGPDMAPTMYSSVGFRDEHSRTLRAHPSTAQYWVDNLEQQVKFSSALLQLAAEGPHHLVEIGPHSALRGPIEANRANSDFGHNLVHYTPTLLRGKPSNLCLKRVAAELFVCGYDLDWHSINDLSPLDRTVCGEFEPYPWDYSAGLLWHEPRASMELRNRQYIRHELLGSRQLAGSGISWNWRNIIRLNEVPWLRDHKLNSQVVFPAAGYLAMAIEAVSQIQSTVSGGSHHPSPADTWFEFSNVAINAALIIPEDESEGVNAPEVHTEMAQRKISNAATSSEWYEFSISSWYSSSSVVHCVGSLRLVGIPRLSRAVQVSDQLCDRHWSLRPWYEKAHTEGLEFGPHFQSLDTLRLDGSRMHPHAIATTRLVPTVAQDPNTYYPIHPITIDACFQAAIMGATHGNIRELEPFVPVFLSSCHLRTIDCGLTQAGTIHTRSATTSFSTRDTEGTLWNKDKQPVIIIQGARMSLIQGKDRQETLLGPENRLQRHPCLRIRWKPDIHNLHESASTELARYISSFEYRCLPSAHSKDGIPVIAALLELVAHKNPRMRVLELGGDGRCEKACLPIIGHGTAFSQYHSWSTGNIGQLGEVSINDGLTERFDAVIIHASTPSAVSWKDLLQQVDNVVSEHGIIINRCAESVKQIQGGNGFVAFQASQHCICAKRRSTSRFLPGKEVLLIVHELSQAVLSLVSYLTLNLKAEDSDIHVSCVPLSQLQATNINDRITCICLLETDHAFVANMTQQEMDQVRLITNVARYIVWLTGAGLLSCPDPNLALGSGFSRALMLEQPSLRFTILDIGSIKDQNLEGPKLWENVRTVLRTMLGDSEDDREFIQQDGLLYVSRFYPDSEFNSLFQQRLEGYGGTERKPLVSDVPARLAVGELGLVDTIHFVQSSDPVTNLPPGFVDIDIKAVGLNAKDVYTLTGRAETRSGTAAVEFSGVVGTVGKGVQHLQPGDRVAVLYPSEFSTRSRIPAWAVHKLFPHEEFTVISSMLVAYFTALYGLRERAQLRPGETVLIHAGSGALGIASITIAQQLGAIVFATASSVAKRAFVHEKLGVPATHIFNSRNASFVNGILDATGGRGVQVVLNSLTGDLMHASWDCLASFGRFIEVGKRELNDAGRLDMRVFLRNASFIAFDITELLFQEDPFYRDYSRRLLEEVLMLNREGKIRPIPITVFNVENVSEAYRFFSTRDRIGKIVVSLENPNSLVSIVPSKYRTILDKDKCYFLVGCLGGLGRSILRWMFTRGARCFVILSRSGASKPAAHDQIDRLRRVGANVFVVQGDVTVAEDVTKAVEACLSTGKPIGGVVQATMGLKEALFSNMSSEAWHVAIQPKYAGTWNLHKSIERYDESLDFFLMLSSISGSVGTATESNYCAGNAFLDAFAHWRSQTLHKPATSVGLGMVSEVGYLHENPRIENLLRRNGIQPLDEDEFLQIIDLALSSNMSEGGSQVKTPVCPHLLTGLEPFTVRKLQSQGFDVNISAMRDPRASILAASLERHNTVGSDTHDHNSHGTSKVEVDVAWLRTVPEYAVKVFHPVLDAQSLESAVVRLIRRRFSALVLMQEDKIDDKKSFSEFGVDSMIASEIRSWLWTSFKVDVPFLDLLSPRNSIQGLGELVGTQLQQGTLHS